MSGHDFDYNAIEQSKIRAASRRSGKAATYYRTERELLGLSQVKFAKMAGISLATLRSVESGKREPHKRTIAKIETALRNRNSELITNGDMIRRKLMNNCELIAAGRVPCMGTEASATEGAWSARHGGCETHTKTERPNRRSEKAMAQLYAALRGLMKANEYSQPQLARKLDISTGCLSRKMNGRAPFTLDEGYTTLRLFNVPAERLHEIFPPDGRRSTS